MAPIEEVEAEESLRDTITAAFKGGAEEDQTDTQGAEPISGETDHEQPQIKSAESKDATPQKANGAEAKTDDTADKPIDPPARWTKEQKEEFAALDPGIQKILLARNKGLEADYTRKMTEIAQERQRFGSLEQVLGPRRDSWARQGLSDSQALGMIMNYWDMSERDPMQFLQQYARDKGIDLASHFAPSMDEIAQYLNQSNMDGGQVTQPGASINPELQRTLDAIMQQQQALQQGYQQHQQFLTAQQTQQMQAVHAAAGQELTEFQNAADDNGSPLYPFFDVVRQDMAQLMRAGIKNDLKSAYQAAVSLRPELMSQMEESKEISRRRAEERRAQQEAERARRAGASVSGSGVSGYSPHSSDGDDGGKSIRELLQEGFKQARIGNRI